MDDVQPGGSSTQKGHVDVTCRTCEHSMVKTFLVPAGTEGDPASETAVVNPTEEPSRLLDVGQWIMLYGVIIEAASKEKDRPQARHLELEAAQCLDEALKFYDDPENDLPPPEAIFTEPSRRRLRSAPEQFSRRRLINLRAKLPREAAMRFRPSTGREKRRGH